MKKLLPIFLILLAGCKSTVRPSDSSAPTPVPAPALVTVVGGVRAPGSFAWTNGMTATEAIREAGGFSEFHRSLEIQHWDGSSKRYRLTSDYRLVPDEVLRPGDRIVVPRE
jgi:protein involved in polysaccharide export with SLBB domain